MSEKKGKRRQLGRGLSSLLGDEGEDYSELDKVRLSKNVPIEHIEPGRFQPRRLFDQDEIDGLVDSIKDRGILQPILVRRHPDKPTNFEIIAGERRWRAAQRAGLHEVPVIIKELEDGEALEIALVENLQRQDLNPLEEAQGYSRLIEEFSHTQENLAKSLGKSRSHVANMLRLLTLPDSVKEMLDRGDLTAGHARALLTSKNPETVAKAVVSKGLNVRQTELLAQDLKGKPKEKKEPSAGKDADTLAVEKEMSELLGLGVSINYKEDKGGTLVIHYKTLEQLEDVLARLSHRGAAAGAEEGRVDGGAPMGLMDLVDEITKRPPERPEEDNERDESDEELELIESVLALIASRHQGEQDASAASSDENEIIGLEESENVGEEMKGEPEETAHDEEVGIELSAEMEESAPDDESDAGGEAAFSSEEPTGEEPDDLGEESAGTYSSMDLDEAEEAEEEQAP